MKLSNFQFLKAINCPYIYLENLNLFQLQFRFILVLLGLLNGISGQAQHILFESSSEIAYYEIIGDTVKITIEDLVDFSLDTTYTGDSSLIDFVQVMVDHNQSGTIDIASYVDKYYGYSPQANQFLCAGNLINTSSIDACGSLSTNGTASATIGVSVTSNTPHLIYTLSIPRSELFNGSHVCSRVSIKMHQAGDAVTTITFMPSAGSTNYFVDPYMPLLLFDDVNLGHDKTICEGDTLFSNESYPYYLWGDNSDKNYIIPTDSGVFHLTIKDNTCSLSDTIIIDIDSQEFCESKVLKFPNVMTPNDDGMNDFFEPIPNYYQSTLDYSSAELSIYNRWGMRVGGRKNLPPFWDGYLEWGQKAPSGTYFYVYDDGQGNIVNGFFTLIYTER